MKFAALVMFFCFVLQAASSQKQLSNVLQGVVVEARTGIPVDGVSVKAFPSLNSTVTDGHGKFVLRSASACKKIQVTGIGFGEHEISVEDFIKTGGKIILEKQITELAAVVLSPDHHSQSRSISKIAIQTKGINNSQELLTMMPGLFIGQHAGGGKAEQIFLRGFDADHGTDINITVDGMPVNMVSHAHGQGYADLHFLIPELVENIEFGKGPYYADKGDFATAGYVSFNTKHFIPVSSIKAEVGQYGILRTVALVNLMPENIRRKNESLFVAAEHVRSNGYFDHPQNLNRINLFARNISQLGKRNSLNVSTMYFSSSWNASGQIPERAVDDGAISFFGAIDPNEGGETRRASISGVLTTSFNNGRVMRNQLYASVYNFDLFSNFTFFKVDSIRGDQIRQREKRLTTGYNGRLGFTHFLGGANLSGEAGVTIRSDITRGSELSRTYNRNFITARLMSGDVKQLNTSAYLKEKISIGKLSINAGLRIDRFDFDYDDANTGKASTNNENIILSPKISVTYEVANNFHVYMNSGRGFHSNDARVSVYKMRNEILPSATGSDAGVILKPLPNLYVNAAIWHLQMKDELIYAGDEGSVESAGKTKRIGFDLTVRYQPWTRIFIDLDMNYARARLTANEKGNNYVPLAPEFTSAGGVLYKSRNGLNLGARYRWMAKRPANEDYSSSAEGYFVTDIMLGYTRSKYEMKIAAANIFNTMWKETQFETESRLRNERHPVSEIHFTPGTPLSVQAAFTWFIKY